MASRKKPKTNVMQGRGLAKAGVHLKTRGGRPSTVFRKQPTIVLSEKASRKTPSFKKAGKAWPACICC